MTQLVAFKAKYAQLYPEAVRSLAEEEEHTLTFYEFPETMHRYIRTTNAIESLFSNVRQRTDQIRRVHHGAERPDHRLGDYRGDYPEKDLSVKRGALHSTNMSNQPERAVKGEVGFLRFKRSGYHEPKRKHTFFGAKTRRPEGKWRHGEERAMG